MAEDGPRINVNLFLALALGTSVAGGTFWLASLNARLEKAEAFVMEDRQEEAHQKTEGQNIVERLIRAEERQQTMMRRLDDITVLLRNHISVMSNGGRSQSTSPSFDRSIRPDDPVDRP